MPITIPTRSELSTAIKAFFTTRFPSRNLGTEGFLGKTWRALAMAIWALELAVQDADRDACPTSDTSADGLDNWAEALGLPNGDDAYGRKGATAATGGVVQATGTNGTVINDGTEAVGSDGVTIFESTGGPYTIAAGVASVTMLATTAGTAGNLDVDEVVTWVSPPAGLDASADVTTAFSGGTDQETDAALLARIQFRLRNPPKGGTAADYRYWCENAENVTTGDAIAIARAYVYPRRSGTGSVDMVVTVSGAGTSRKPGATITGDVQDYVDSVRPVTVEEANVLQPYMPAASGMTIRCRMVPSLDANDFDWDDTAAAYPTVIAGGTTTLLRISGSPPTALTDAFAASTASTRPRIQIGNTTSGAPAKAEERRVTNIDTVTINPNTILTLSSALTVYPTATNVVYAGGPMVSDTQDAIIDYVDALGPSRESGFADPDDPWFTDCTIAKLTQVALDTVDGSEVAYSQNIVAGGVTINGVATDVSPTDTLADGPQILYASLVLVTA
jgi:uncharacterized phage protein gp47/JayE